MTKRETKSDIDGDFLGGQKNDKKGQLCKFLDISSQQNTSRMLNNIANTETYKSDLSMKYKNMNMIQR